MCPEAYTWSTPFIYVDHDVSLPAIPSTPRTGRRRRPLDCRFRRLSRRMSTHRQLPPLPGYVCPSGPSDGLRSITPYAPGVGAPDQRFLLPLPSLRSSRAGLVSHMAQAFHDANDPASACGIDGLHKFPIFPLATPTRTSLASFEPLLPLLTCRFSSFSILLLYCSRRYPASALASSRELSHSGTRSAVCWIC